MSTRWRKTWWALGLCGALTASSSSAADEPLGRLEAKPVPGWDGVRLGMSLVSLERRVGRTLAIDRAAGQPVCSRFAAQADHNGYRLVLGFPAAKPGARLESLWVQFAGAEASLGPGQLGAALKRRLPEARYLGSATSEEEDPLPVYELPASDATPNTAGGTAALRLAARDGMLLALRGCLDKAPAPN